MQLISITFLNNVGEVYANGLGQIQIRYAWEQASDKSQRREKWLPVNQCWAGQQGGFQSIPRVGDKVLVDFIDGQADQPIVLGTLYAGIHKVPRLLQQQALMGISSARVNSSIRHEIHFDARPGKEQFCLRAGKDFCTTIQGDRYATVQGSYTVTVMGDLNVSVQQGAMLFEAKEKIILSVGSSHIQLTQDEISCNSAQIQCAQPSQ